MAGEEIKVVIVDDAESILYDMEPQRAVFSTRYEGATAIVELEYVGVDVGDCEVNAYVDYDELDFSDLVAYVCENGEADVIEYLEEVLDVLPQRTTDVQGALDILNDRAMRDEYLSYSQLVNLVLQQTQSLPAKIGGLLTGLLMKLDEK